MIAENADLHRAQRSFRQVLDAFARPGKVCTVEPDADDDARPASLDGSLSAFARLFIDQAVTFSVVDAESDAASRYLSSETHARRTAADLADFVIVPARADGKAAADAVIQARPGTLASPELGATVILGCARIAQDDPGDGGMQCVAVSGPGVKDVNRFFVDRAGWVAARAARNDEFPCGVDLALVSVDGAIAAIPRTSTVVLEREER